MTRPSSVRLVTEAMWNTVKSSATVASGGSTTITVPASGGGTITIYATSGGSWDSVWHGVYVAGTGRVNVTQTATNFTTPGNAIASVTTTGSSLIVTVTAAATGSNVVLRWTVRTT